MIKKLAVTAMLFFVNNSAQAVNIYCQAGSMCVTYECNRPGACASPVYNYDLNNYYVRNGYINGDSVNLYQSRYSGQTYVRSREVNVHAHRDSLVPVYEMNSSRSDDYYDYND